MDGVYYYYGGLHRMKKKKIINFQAKMIVYTLSYCFVHTWPFKAGFFFFNISLRPEEALDLESE